MLGRMLPAVVQAPIGAAAAVELVLAVGEAGGRSTLGASWTPPEGLRDQVRQLQQASERPLAAARA